MQSRCVQTAENAFISPESVRTRIPGLLPNLKIFPELTGSSFSFAAMTELSVDSIICGGDMKRNKIGRARLNSSHGYISYAVFCLKKKKINSEVNRVVDCVGEGEVWQFVGKTVDVWYGQYGWMG